MNITLLQSLVLIAHAIVAAAVSGSAAAMLAVAANPSFTAATLVHAAWTGAVIGVASYFVHSPLEVKQSQLSDTRGMEKS
jgi:hypothetical protein